MVCRCQILVSDTDTRMTLVGHVSVKCLIQKVFVGFLTILVQFQHNFIKEKYIIFLKTQTYCMNFYYDYKNKKQILLN